MKGYECHFIRTLLNEREKQEFRATFLRKRDFVLSSFGENRTINCLMLCGELNVLEGIGVYSKETAEKYRKELLSWA